MIYSCGSADGDTNFLPRTVQHTGALKVLLLTISVNCQLLRDEERPTRYVLPYSGLGGGEDQEVTKEDHYYKPNRRAERIPATAYQYDEAEEEYYRPQPRHKVESDNYRYQPNTPSHKDYEEILKHNHLVRLRVAAKKTQPPQPPPTAPPQPQAQPQPVEQYLKEVNPTTKTAYQRPANYLRYSGQSPVLKQEQNEETPALKQQPYRYVLQSDLQQQKTYPQYQYDRRQQFITPVQPKTRHFNSVEYQNALIADQLEEGPSIYITQNTANKPIHPKTQKPSTQTSRLYKYYTQLASQRQSNVIKLAPVRYVQKPTRRNQKSSTYEAEESSGEFRAVQQLFGYQTNPELKYQDDQLLEATAKDEIEQLPAYKPQTRTKSPRYPEKKEGKRATTYLNGQMFLQEVTPMPRYRYDDLATQSSSNVQVGYDGDQQFLILVYDE